MEVATRKIGEIRDALGECKVFAARGASNPQHLGRQAIGHHHYGGAERLDISSRKLGCHFFPEPFPRYPYPKVLVLHTVKQNEHRKCGPWAEYFPGNLYK